MDWLRELAKTAEEIVYYRWRRWWELVFKALRPAMPADRLMLLQVGDPL